MNKILQEHDLKPNKVDYWCGKSTFALWDKVVDLKKQKGEVLTVLTEFGQQDYMPTLPCIRLPL